MQNETATKSLRILVVDDSSIHRAAAEAQLAGHDLAVAKDFAEGQEKILNGEYDAVMVDLHLPSGELRGLNGQHNPAPVGTALALLAVQKGVRYVGVLTDANHHADFASASLDEHREPIRCGSSVLLLENYHCSQWYGRWPDGGLVREAQKWVGSELVRYPVQLNLDLPQTAFDARGLVKVKEWGEFLVKIIGS